MDKKEKQQYRTLTKIKTVMCPAKKTKMKLSILPKKGRLD